MRSRRPTSTRRDLMKRPSRRRSAAVADDDRSDAATRRARPVARRDRRPRRGPAGRGARPARRSSARSSATSSGPRAGATARSTSPRPSRRAATCSSATAAMPARPASRSRPSAGRSSAALPGPRRRPRARATRACRLAVDLALPARDVDYALHRDLAALAPCGPGNPDPLIAVLGLTVTRVRAATGGHTQLTLASRTRRPRRDRLRPGRPRRDRPRRRSDRRRRPPDEPALRRLRVAPARDPRRRHGWRARSTLDASWPPGTPALAGSVS